MKRNKKRIALETPCCMLAGSIQSIKISANDVATQEEIDVAVKNDGQAVKASDINTRLLREVLLVAIFRYSDCVRKRKRIVIVIQ